MLKNILEFILKILTYKTPPKQDQQDKDDDVVVNIPVEIETPVIVPEIKPSEVYTMLSVKEYQTYFKKIGLYTKGIDGIVGNGTEKAIYQFNTIFLNDKSDVYTEKTDKLLRIIYETYSKSPYMKSTDWQFFRNFRESEYGCTCRGKHCDGWNGLRSQIPIHLVMMNQYVRNYFNAIVSITSAVRDVIRNKEVGGTTNSRHIAFRATDFGVKNHKAEEVRQLVAKDSDKKLPFVSYAYNINTNYIHVDVYI